MKRQQLRYFVSVAEAGSIRQAARAFGAAFTVSAFGGVVGALIMAASLPILLPMIMAFGVPEFFFLAVLGLTIVGVLAGGSILKGLTVAAVSEAKAMRSIGLSIVLTSPRASSFSTNVLV